MFLLEGEHMEGDAYQALAVSHKEVLSQRLAVDSLQKSLQRHSFAVHPAERAKRPEHTDNDSSQERSPNSSLQYCRLSKVARVQLCFTC